MKKWVLISFVFFVSGFSFSQNLVPNPGFEIYSTCPDNGGQISYLSNWTNPTWQSSSSPDFFHTCGTLGYGLPNTIFGYNNAYEGNSCSGIVTFAQFSDAREYLQVELLDTLVSGYKYCLEFYALLNDSLQYGANEIGAFFSSNIVDTNTFFNLPYTPQVVNSNSNPLLTKGQWVAVSGDFIADGGEKFMIIGNFNDNVSTNEVYLGGASGYNFSLYFIDSISLTLCDSLNSINENTKELQIYPNPTSDYFTIKSNEDNINVTIYNSLGTIVKVVRISFSSRICVSNLANGIYHLELDINNKKSVHKIIINH